MLKRTKGEKVFAVFNVALLLLMSFIFIVPIWHVAMSSISDPMKVSANTGLALLPLGQVNFGGYSLALHNANLVNSFGNTLINVAVGVTFGVIMNILAAYVLSRKEFIGRGFVVFLITFTMIFNGGLIPTYMVIRDLHLLDTRWAVILSGAVTAYNIIIMRTSFANVPDSLIEAAYLDGAGHFTILTRIVVPVSKSIIAVVALLYGIYHWNEWFNASIYLQNRGLYPLQLQLREIVLLSTENSIVADASADDVEIYRPLIKYATIMVSVIPMIIVYPFAQKYFVTGVMIGSVKG